jgi:hypothetical protein
MPPFAAAVPSRVRAAHNPASSTLECAMPASRFVCAGSMAPGVDAAQAYCSAVGAAVDERVAR